MRQHIMNEKGNTLITSLVLVVIMGYIGASLLDVSSNDSSNTVNEMQTIQVLQIGNGGLQEALEKINNGESPNVESKTLGAGSYAITTDPNSQLVTVTASVGQARKVQTLTTNFSKQVTELDVTPAWYTNRELNGIEVIKNGNNRAVLSGMKITWNWTNCAENLTCTPTTGTANPSSDPATGKVTICHIPPGNPSNAHTISVGAAAQPAHLAHGDTLGVCAGTSASDPVVCEGYEADIAACGATGSGPEIQRIVINGITVANNISAESGELIDITDVDLIDNQAYLVDEIRFSQNLPDEVWYQVTFYFADGSEQQKSFKFSEPTSHGNSGN